MWDGAGVFGKYFSELVRLMPKRGKYILLDGLPEQGVVGQMMRGKYNYNMSTEEVGTKLMSADKYRFIAEQLYNEFVKKRYVVEKYISTLNVDTYL
jgi:hypothetical protein